MELCAALREPLDADWGALRRAWELGSLSTLPELPSFIHVFAMIAQDIASWMTRERESFAIGDPIKNASMTTRLPSAVLIPPVPELLVTGLSPFSIVDGAPQKATIPPGSWIEKDLLLSSGSHLFLQLASLLPEEFEVALNESGWNFFMHGLLPTDAELDNGLDSSAFIADLSRQSRLGEYREAVKRLGG
jgi:hypothetical protein